jgi:hypothetical protein
VWQELRALRASPLGLAGQDRERREVFGGALRQAQELADASAASGYATRPLPLFYCLSQGLRAVSAALIEDDAWQIRGHGAQIVTTNPMLDTTIVPKRSIRQDARDALSAIYALADGQPMTASMRLAAVWAACPGLPTLPDDVRPEPGPLRLHLPSRDLISQHAQEGRVELAVEGLDADLSDEALQRALKSYPSLSGGRSPRGPITAQRPSVYRTGERAQVLYGFAQLKLSFDQWRDRSPVLTWPIDRADLETHTTAFHRIAPVEIEAQHNVRMALPAVGGVDAPEFLALWWVLLLALSSLVRYEPAHWTRAIEPDSSKLAVPLEQISDSAESFIPGILLSVLTAAQVTTRSTS